MIDSIFLRFSRGARFGAVAALALGLFASVNLLDLPGTVPYMRRISAGRGILDMHFFYDADGAYRILDALGESGRHVYLWLLASFDLVFPAVMALFFGAAITALYSPRAARVLRVAPLAALALDYGENLAAASLLLAYPSRWNGVAALAGYLTATKFVAYGLSVAALLVGGVRGLLFRSR